MSEKENKKKEVQFKIYSWTIFFFNVSKSNFKQEEVIKIEVKDNNVDQALRILKRKLQREGFFKILKIKSSYEKPSERKKRERSENIKRAKKINRMRNNI